MKSQLFIPLDGTLLKRIGISTLSPAFATTVSITTVNPSGIGDDVGCTEPPTSTPPSLYLAGILFRS
jgi:hypothetical protein